MSRPNPIREYQRARVDEMRAALRQEARYRRHSERVYSSETLHRQSQTARGTCWFCGNKWPCPNERRARKLDAIAKGEA